MKFTYTYLESESRTLEEAYEVIQLRLQGRRHCVYMYNIIARAICNKPAYPTFLMYFDTEVEVNERSGCYERRQRCGAGNQPTTGGKTRPETCSGRPLSSPILHTGTLTLPQRTCAQDAHQNCLTLLSSVGLCV